MYLPVTLDKNIIAGTTLRDITQPEDFSFGYCDSIDDKEINRNKERLCKELNFSINRMVFLKQTHSDHIKEITKEDIGKGSTSHLNLIYDYDASYTREKNVMLTVMHADCVPILIYCKDQEIVCGIHSGWAGTVKEITRKCVEHLITQENCMPENMFVYVGPCIQKESFEVGNDVIEKIQNMSFDTSSFIQRDNSEKAHADNQGLNVKQLLNCGIPLSNIQVSPIDTFHDKKCFSYRKDKTVHRHMSFIYRI